MIISSFTRESVNPGSQVRPLSQKDKMAELPHFDHALPCSIVIYIPGNNNPKFGRFRADTGKLGGRE